MVHRYIFTIVSYLIGVFIFATIVGQVGNVITNRNANRLEFERLLDGAKTYMRHHKVPGGMKRRVLRWYDYSWSRGRIQGGGDINTALGLLPDKLKTELALHVNLSVLKKVIFLISSYFFCLFCVLYDIENTFFFLSLSSFTPPKKKGDNLSRMSTRILTRPSVENESIYFHPRWFHLSQGWSGSGNVHHCRWDIRSAKWNRSCSYNNEGRRFLWRNWDTQFGWVKQVRFMFIKWWWQGLNKIFFIACLRKSFDAIFRRKKKKNENIIKFPHLSTPQKHNAIINLFLPI